MVPPDSPTAPPASTRHLWLRLLAVLALAAVAAGAWYVLWRPPALPEAGPNPWRGPIPVRLTPVQQRPLTEQVKAIGTVTPMQTVVVRSRVDGTLARVLFQEGQEVRKGQLLAEIDPEPYRVRLAQAEGLQQQNQAQLQSAERDLARYRSLFQQDSIARQQLDTQEALVAQLRGGVQSVRAQVAEARLQLSYTRIEAPTAGRLGLRRIDAGNLVSASDTQGLVTLTQTRPIAVVFSVPETQLAAVRASWRGTGNGTGKPLLDVQAWDRAEGQQIAAGRLTTLDNQIDTATGTLRLKAQFDNADDSLFPNQFVNVRLQVRTHENALVIPADAVQHGSQGTYVYTVQDAKARLRRVTLGAGDGEYVLVQAGLNAGEQVVLEGLDRLREGSNVVTVAEGAPAQTARQLQASAKAQTAAASAAPAAPASQAPASTASGAR
ncbi:MAG: efflux RND transporter periplasmic adaptor subunit [Comamonadaceae bacterium]|nr:MAG: efflux RND transporter periplasmic adaptor subunit [Comamonadaceae bacterium]